MAHFAALGVLLVLQQPATPPTAAAVQSVCSSSQVSPGDAALTQVCAAEQALQRASRAPKGTRERNGQLDVVVATLRRAVALSSDTRTTVAALNLLAVVYDAEHLDEPAEQERVLRELIGVTPEDLRPLYRLAKLQEDRELIDAAEATLLDARHRQPDEEEPNRMLAQFYARRVTALHKRNLQTAPETISNPGEPDANGVYRIGDSLPAPKRSDLPQYPVEAAVAGIQGAVQTEIVIDAAGNVTDARVVRSIPMLDEAALKAVQNWRFTPTVVNGQPVPVRMTVTVNFTPPAAPERR